MSYELGIKLGGQEKPKARANCAVSLRTLTAARDGGQYLDVDGLSSALGNEDGTPVRGPSDRVKELGYTCGACAVLMDGGSCDIRPQLHELVGQARAEYERGPGPGDHVPVPK